MNNLKSLQIMPVIFALLLFECFHLLHFIGIMLRQSIALNENSWFLVVIVITVTIPLVISTYIIQIAHLRQSLILRLLFGLTFCMCLYGYIFLFPMGEWSPDYRYAPSDFWTPLSGGIFGLVLFCGFLGLLSGLIPFLLIWIKVILYSKIGIQSNQISHNKKNFSIMTFTFSILALIGICIQNITPKILFYEYILFALLRCGLMLFSWSSLSDNQLITPKLEKLNDREINYKIKEGNIFSTIFIEIGALLMAGLLILQFANKIDMGANIAVMTIAIPWFFVGIAFSMILLNLLFVLNSHDKLMQIYWIGLLIFAIYWIIALMDEKFTFINTIYGWILSSIAIGILFVPIWQGLWRISKTKTSKFLKPFVISFNLALIPMLYLVRVGFDDNSYDLFQWISLGLFILAGIWGIIQNQIRLKNKYINCFV